MKEKELAGVYRETFDGAPYAAVLIRMIFEDGKAVDYEYVYANPAAKDVLGLPCQDFVGKKYTECFPGMMDQNIELYDKAVKENKPGRRAIFSAEISGYIDIAYSKVGEDLCLVMAYESTPAFSDAEQTLAASMSAFDMIISVNLTKNIYHMINYDKFHNTKAPRHGNFNQLIKDGMSTLPARWKKPFFDAFARENQLKAFDEGEKIITLEHQQYSNDGSLHWVRTQVIRIENHFGDDVLQVTTAKLIDERKDTEQKKYRYLLDSISCGYMEYYINEDNTLTYREFNREACLITGRSKELLDLKKVPAEITQIEKDSAYWEEILRKAEENPGKRINYLCKIRNGTESDKFIWVAGYVTLLPDETGKPYIQDVFMNVDAQRKHEIELKIKSEALRIALSKTETSYFYYYPKEERFSMEDNAYRIHVDSKNNYDSTKEFIEEFVAEEFHSRTKEMFERIKNGEENLEMEFQSKDDEKWIKTEMAVIERDDEGKPLLVIGFSDDITEEKNRSIEVQETLAGISNSFAYIHRVHLPSETVTAIKQPKSLERLINRKESIDDILNKVVERNIPEEYREAYLDFLDQNRIAGVLNWEHTTETLDVKMLIGDEYRWIRNNIILASMKGDKVESYIVALRDITEEKEAEFAVQETVQERNRLIFAISVIFESMFIIDLSSGQYHTIKKFDTDKGLIGTEGAFTDILYSYAEYMQEKHANIFKETFSMDRIMENISEKNPVLALELPLKFEGVQYWLRYNAILISVEGEESNTIAFTTLNVTPEREKEARHQEALQIAFEAAQKANNAKSEFLSRMSHDIRTPMNVIMGMTAIAKGQTENRERIIDCLNKIDLSSRHLLELINEILDMSRIEAGHLKPTEESFDISDTISELITLFRPLADNRKQILSTEIGELKNHAVIGDEKLVKQALINFMSNAVKYTSEGGHIRFAVSEKKAERSGFVGYEFIFEDDGLGMQPEFIEHIFEPFSREEDSRTSKIQGTGLGMTIAYNIIKMMNGTIDVESAPGKGSKFTVVFFLKKQKILEKLSRETKLSFDFRERKDSVPDLSKENYSGKKFLLAEDNFLNREIIQELLTATGAQVDVTENGKEAVKLFEESQDGYYDLIILDIQMPVMDGYEAVAVIRAMENRKDAKTIPIFAMTANAFVDDIKLTKQAGMNEHIAKPIDMEVMKRALQKWLK